MRSGSRRLSLAGSPLALAASPIVLALALLAAGTLLAQTAWASGGALGIAKWEAGTCAGSESQVKSCEYSSPPSAFYTQAAGHPPWGLTGFELAHTGTGDGRVPEGAPLKRIRVDVPPGLAADPQALASCTRTQFNEEACPADSQAGFVELEAVVELPLVGDILLTLKGKVFNLDLQANLPLLFGIDIEGIPPLVHNVDLFLEGHVSYAYEPALAARGAPSGDFHEYFEINNIPTKVPVEPLGVTLTEAPLKTLKSKLFFNGHAGAGGNEDFLTLPSVCGAPSLSTSYLETESYAGELATAATVPPVGVSGCGAVPFAPTATLTPETSSSDAPDGVTVEVHAPQHAGSAEINTADIADAQVTLPEGLTLDPSAAAGLATCAPAQIAIGSARPVECPAGSRIGSVTIETDLPPHSLTGSVYLGDPTGGPIAGPPFTIYLDAESSLGVSVRLQGQVSANPSTGRLETTFLHNPPLPFSDLILTLSGGPRAPLANPLSCVAGHLEALFTPYTGGPPALDSEPFAPTGCPSNPPPFSWSQATQTSNPDAGAHTDFTFTLARAAGQQYLSALSTTLPAGLVGEIPSVPLCAEPLAAQGACPSASQIGTATVAAGSGPEPYTFTGPAFLTGPYAGSPYGLSIAVPAIAGPFDFGTVITRAAIGVDPTTARVTVTSSLPTILAGVPLRLRSIAVAVTRPNFMLNPTSCSPLTDESTLTGFASLGAPAPAPATQTLSSPFQVSGCAALAFKPAFAASTDARTASKAGGVSLRVSLTQPAHEANIHSVFAQLPLQLPSRLTTLQKACPEATFAANPVLCRARGAEVGAATVSTPVLPGALHGSAYLVSHGGAAFPDLDLVLAGDGVTVVLTGATQIHNGVTSTTFASVPDVPVSSFTLTLPVGPDSALADIGRNPCAAPLVMPTTITAQSGAVFHQQTRIAVRGCPAASCPAAPHAGGHRARGHHPAGRTPNGGPDRKPNGKPNRKANHNSSHSASAGAVKFNRGHCRYGHHRACTHRRSAPRRCAPTHAHRGLRRRRH